MDRRIGFVEKLISDIARDEITPEYQAKLNKISKSVDSGKGMIFRSPSQIKKFFKNL